MSDWKEYSLGNLVELVIDYRGKTPLKLGGNWSNSGYRALSAKNIKTGQIVNEESIRFVDEDLYRKWMKDEVQQGDILITSEAPFGQVFFWDSDEKIVLSQRLFCLRMSSKVCPRFVYYYTTTHTFQHELDGRATGTTVIGLRQPELLKCRIKLPAYKEQVHIADVLKSLDDKIECNRRINENLEQQAQALFKSWFVDFEPFKDQPFVESELGMIPQGWKVVELSDIAEISKVSINPLKHSQTVFEHYSIPSYDNGLKPEIQLGEDIKSNKFVIENRMVLFSKLNPRIKRVWYVDNVGANSVCSTEFVPYKAKEESKSSFLYSLINGQGFYDFVMSMVNGATGSHQRFHPEESLKYKVAYNEGVCEKFSAIITPMINQILGVREESRRLAELRDTLLPKLMSGELKVNDVNV